MSKDFFSKITGHQKNIIFMVVEIVLVVAICAGSIAGVAVMSNRNDETSSQASSEASSTASVSSAEEIVSSEVSSEVSSATISSEAEVYSEPAPEPVDPIVDDNTGDEPDEDTPSYTTDPETITGILKWSEDQFLPSLPAAAPVLDFIAENDLTTNEKLMFTSLKGIVNKSQPRIYSAGVSPELSRLQWADLLELKFNPVGDPYDLIAKYRSELEGIVVWDDTDRSTTHTINLACTAAGIEKLLIVAPEDALEISERYDLPIKYDYSNSPELAGVAEEQIFFGSYWDIYDYQLETYGNLATNRVILSLNPDPETGIINDVRDYIIAIGGMSIWLDPTLDMDKEVLDKYFVRMAPGKSVCLGWWPDEPVGVTYTTGFGVVTLASDYCQNLSYFAGCQEELLKAPTEEAKQYENKIYVALVESDGDNLQYMQGYLRELWQQPERGEVPITYTMTPTLADVARPIWNYYVKTRTDNDFFCDGPSAYGYIYPKAWNEQRIGYDKASTLGEFLKRSDRYMNMMGLRVITVWNSGTGAMNTDVDRDNLDLLKAYANNMPSLLGITQQEGMSSYNGHADRDVLINGNFLVRPAEKSYCSEQYQMEEGVRFAIEQYYNLKCKEPVFYVDQAVVWNFGNTITKMKGIADYGKLLAGDDIEFVSLDQLFMMQTQYIKDKNGLN